MIDYGPERAHMDNPSLPLRILIVDDHSFVRAGLVALLTQEADFTVVGEASDGAEAVRLHESLRPDITLMDLGLPGFDGVEAIRRIRLASPLALVIVLSTFEGEEDVFNALRAGAKSYMLKDADPMELFFAMRKVWSGKTYVPAEIAGKLADRLRAEALTDREVQILQLVASGKSNRQIGLDLHISEGTVKVHLKNILGKLDATSRTEAAAIAHRRGIVRM